MIKRTILEPLKEALQPGKVVILYGPRRVGKTTLLKEIEASLALEGKYVDGEENSVQSALSSGDSLSLQKFLGSTELLIVDEAQQIPQIGKNLKLLVDHFPKLRILASGSASFSLAQQVGEPLTGRKKTLHLFPLSLQELTLELGFEKQPILMRENLLIYGGYPEAFILSYAKRAAYLKEIVDSYLFRDILALEDIRNAKKIRDLLTLLAFQIGQEVSLSELGNRLDVHKDTVCRYLDLLEKSFVLLNVRGFSRNLRNEVTKTSRYYFFDNGIRNALINNFNPVELRDDIGQLCENFLAMERIKKQSYENILSNNYFWRTYDQQEIDWVEEREGKLFGYEFKWSKNKRNVHAPKKWQTAYPNALFECITPENYQGFIGAD